jgi:hypothetical protein
MLPIRTIYRADTSLACHFFSVVSCLLAVFVSGAHAQESSGLPDWLSFEFEQQTRMQALEGQFRAGLDGSDQTLEWRHLLKIDAAFEKFSVTTELADMRTYFSDSGTPLDGGITNPLDILQLNVTVPLQGVFREDDEGFIRIGRFTMDQGARRLAARNRYRNTINAFSGIYSGLAWDDTNIELFYSLPTARRYSGDPLDNDPRLDNEPGNQIFWGAFFTTRLPNLLDMVEVYLYGLDENRDQAANQRLKILTPGLRFYRSPRPSRWHYEFDNLIQVGDAPARDAISPLRNHKARFTHLEIGYSFDAPWQPRLSFIYDYASGDKNPLDGDNNSFDSLYGVPRPEYGPTGTYRAFVRNNINTPGLLLNLEPRDNVDAFVKLQRYSLATQAQGWKTTRYRHPGGLGEDYVGTQLETRLRWHVLNRKLTIEGGYTWLNAGDYMSLVGKGDSHYYYIQTILRL